jgi:Ala-tRNA(Pro) deacylase
MAIERLKAFLREQGVWYELTEHPPTYTAQETAHAAHITGKMLAKTVIAKLDGALAMVVLPADERIDLDRLRHATGTSHASLAHETEFAWLFADDEVGAMPPFGNLYGLPVYLDECLAEHEELSFNAGTHTDVITMRMVDFERLVQPTVLRFGRIHAVSGLSCDD